MPNGAKWTPECPHPDEILDLATGSRIGESRKVLEHLRDCEHCLGLYADTLSTLRHRVDRSAEGANVGVNQHGLPPPDSPGRSQGHDSATRLRRISALRAILSFGAGAATVACALYLLVLPKLEARSELLESQLRVANGDRLDRSEEVRRLKDALALARSKPLQVAAAAPTSDDDSKALEEAVLTGRLKVPSGVLALASIVRGAGTSHGGGIGLISPVNTFVLSSRPVLFSKPESGVTDLKPFLSDADGNDVPLSRISATSWQSRGPLQPNRAYQWAVEGQRNGERVRSAIAGFQVVGAATSETIAKARRKYRDQPLTLAVIYAEAGLLDEAEAKLEELLDKHPVSATPLKLLRNLRAKRSGGE